MYSGMQVNPDVDTVEGRLLEALQRAGCITADNSHPSKISFSRAGRTDKGVHAYGQVVCAKLLVPSEDHTSPELCAVVDAVNEHLPPDIRLLGIRRVANTFDARKLANGRYYRFLVPSFAFFPKDKVLGHSLEELRTLRLQPPMVQLINDTTKRFLGTHRFHNYTKQMEGSDAKAQRLIRSFECIGTQSDPQTGLEFADLMIHGQSFLLNQIRKMVAMTCMVVRGDVELGTLVGSLDRSRTMNLPIAPGHGLMLHQVNYEFYHHRIDAGKLEGRQKLLWQEEEGVVEKFLQEQVFPAVFAVENGGQCTLQWLEHLERESLPMLHKSLEAGEKLVWRGRSDKKRARPPPKDSFVEGEEVGAGGPSAAAASAE